VKDCPKEKDVKRVRDFEGGINIDITLNLWTCKYSKAFASREIKQSWFDTYS